MFDLSNKNENVKISQEKLPSNHKNAGETIPNPKTYNKQKGGVGRSIDYSGKPSFVIKYKDKKDIEKLGHDPEFIKKHEEKHVEIVKKNWNEIVNIANKVEEGCYWYDSDKYRAGNDLLDRCLDYYWAKNTVDHGQLEIADGSASAPSPKEMNENKEKLKAVKEALNEFNKCTK